jgi:DNA-binding response OmpR family regulator
MLVLVAEDNRRMAQFLRQGLRELDFAVDIVYNGEDAVSMARTGAYDVILLDIMLPGRSGFDVIRELRDRSVATPIICLTARDATGDKVTGLDLGADDYLTKPFEFLELLARIRAVTRRPADMVARTLCCADLEVELAAHRVTRAGEEIDLTAKEYALLEFLAQRKDQVVTRTSILQHVWGLDFGTLSNVVDVFINRLRNKVDYPFGKDLIKTVRGMGYCLTAGEAPS